MSVSREYVTFLLDQLASLGAVDTRRMNVLKPACLAFCMPVFHAPPLLFAAFFTLRSY